MPLAVWVAVAAWAGIVVPVSLVDRPKVLDGTEVLVGSAGSCLVLDGSAVPVWWREPAGWVERWVGLGQDESRSAAAWAGWMAGWMDRRA
jgi:hypothetical protein